ncbi:MAG: carboxypeptidase regulatory-like domain-containing protein, partial [Planctomycetes bacterium]|nr:carboxypeptidase regulatory-like domain-containing protein [Planctomycetota bacterium]
APAPQQRLRATLAAPAAKALAAALRSDASARVEWALAPLSAPAARELHVVCDLPGGRASARVALPPLQAGALLELTTPLRLELEPLLASGWVRDETGAALRSARVRVQVDSEGGEPAGRFETRSDADGRFELRGRTQAGTGSLLARADGHVERKDAQLALPALDQSLELRRAGALRGKLALPDEFPPEALTLELTCAGEAPRRFQPAQDGTFVQRGLPPGRWSLQASVGREWPCAELAGLEISAGGLCEDPRLLPWDLRRRIGQIEVELVDAEGAPVPLARVSVLDRPAEGDRAARRRDLLARDGWLRIPTSYTSIDVEFHADAKRARRERFLFDGARIELPAALRARVELGSAVPALAKGQALWIALAPARPAQGELAQFTRAELERTLLAARARIGRNGRSASFPMPAAGRYALRVYVGEFKNTKRSRLVLQREVELAGQSDTQVWRMRVDAQRVAAWLGRPAAPR